MPLILGSVRGVWKPTGMNNTLITRQAEQFVHDLSDSILSPRTSECMVCFVDRLVHEFGCNHTRRFATHFRDLRAPRATALKKRMSEVGACCCDCELLLNGYIPARHLWRRRSSAGSAAVELDAVELDAVEFDHDDDDDDDEDPEFPAVMPACEGARKGSILPCTNWMRYDRSLFW